MVTSSSTTNTGSLVACGEATPPSQASSASSASLAVRTAHPSPVVQSSQIDSCVQEVETEQQQQILQANAKLVKKSAEFNNNNNNNTTATTLTTTTVQHWLKPEIITNASQIVAG
jgi:hypothetical protein